jgi:hypothetical protein
MTVPSVAGRRRARRPPSASKDLVAIELALLEAQKAAKSAEKERDARRRAPGDETYTAEALTAAELKHVDALRHVNKLEK